LLGSGGKLRQIGVQPVGAMVYELADGTKHEYPFGLVEIRFMVKSPPAVDLRS
jgi:hypothetical protein